MNLVDHFGLLAPIYERFIKPRPPEWLWKVADLPTDGTLLDAGGGTGRVAQFFVDKAAQVVVADLSFNMLQQANSKLNLRTVCTHTENLPFPDNHFSRVIMVDALHHVCDQAATTKEMWRVLEPGGRIVIEEPDVRETPVKFIALAEKLALMRSHFLTPVEIMALFPPNHATCRIEKDGSNAWIIVDKKIS
jgi:SAM-dependent methyltransferase